MEWLIQNAIAAALVPPGVLVLTLLAGFLLLRRRRWVGRAVIAFTVAALYVLSTQYAADRLLLALEPAPADPRASPAGEVIVVLGAGTYFDAPEYGATTVNGNALVRLRYAAHLHRHTGKPILVAGGSPEGAPVGEAVYMKAVLERDFGVPVQWTEAHSRNTLENARFSRTLLGERIRRIYLVTQAWHMPRARLAFEHAGFEVIPAPTDYATRFRLTLLDFLPHARALRDSSLFFREALGIAWYRIKFALAR
jgi:uncharacterized SAM-binding protein YcdF (DUF218 family)